MITPQTRTLDWVNHIRELYPKRDPILIEKMIMALTLDLSDWIIEHPDYSKLNKLKESSPEAFFYFCQAIKLIE